MFGVGFLELLVLVVVFAAMAVAVAVGLFRAMRRIDDLDPAVARARRRQGGVTALSGAAALVAIPVGLAAAGQYGAGVVLPLLPSLMVVAACTVLWLGELTFERPSGEVRSTVLNARSTASVVPVAWVRTCLAMGLVTLLALGLVLASGRLVAVPQAIALSAAALLAWLVCHSVTTRPTIASDLHADAVLRRTSGGRVLRWLAWGLTATAAGDLIVGGIDIQNTTSGLPSVLAACGVVAGWLLLVALPVLPFAPVPQLPHTYPAPKADDTASEVR